jgi:site-specific DNA recombinase
MTSTSPPEAGQLQLRSAALYLRVSSPGQVNTDYDPEGISIPAQRTACVRKAEQLGLDIVAEYVEPGLTATSMDKRVAFQELLTRMREQRDIDYVVVYKLSRMNRNRIEDAFVVMQLRAAGATLISATESIDETPAGQLLHGILASINEFRSTEDGADIRYKMGEKAKKGGTLGRAPLGYRNVREDFEGRQVATVVIDDQRAPLVRQAFQLYATGDYTVDRLQQTMADLGLRTRPTRRWSEQPVSVNKLHRMLRDPYYTGVVEYQGTTYPGRHEALISQPLFDRVQDVLDLRSARGTRDRVHQHHLKGMLFCSRCDRAGRQARLIYTQAAGRGGTYAYFFCRGRQPGTCDMPYLPAERVVAAVAREYQRLALPVDFAASLRGMLRDTMADDGATKRLAREQLAAELQRVHAAEERLIDLAADGTLTGPAVRSRLTRLQQDQARLHDELAQTDTSLEAGARLLEDALNLLDKPCMLYQACDNSGKRLLTQTFYERLYVDQDGDTDVTKTVYQPPFDEIQGARRGWDNDLHKALQATKQPQKASRRTKTDLPEPHFQVLGSNKAVMVELRGVEPRTSSMRTKRATNCATAPDAAPRVADQAVQKRPTGVSR